MGLDITGYPKTEVYVQKRTDDLDADYERRYDEAHQFKAHPQFERSQEGLEDDTWYVTDHANRIDMGHWGYFGWNKFRETLAQFQGIDNIRTVWEEDYDPEALPLHDIINFTDCDGTIGPVSVKRLAREFAANKDRYMKWLESAGKDDSTTGRYRESYESLTEGFAKIAATGGFVIFH